MKESNNNKRKKIKIVRRLISLIMSFAMLLTAFYVQELDGVFEKLNFPQRIYAANTITENYPINSLEQLYDFSYNYSTDSTFADTYSTANLVININGIWELEEDHAFGEDVRKGFTPIGNASYPFMGMVTINQTEGSYIVMQTKMPFFDVVYDSVEILNSNSGYQQLSIIRTDSLSGNVPLFANTVLHDSRSGSTCAYWRVMASPLVDDTHDYAYDFSGIIGTVGEDAEVNLELDFAACAGQHDADIVSDDNVGLACGYMSQGSTVNLFLLGSDDHSLRSEYNVSTSGSGKSAGGVVGEMASGTYLNVYLVPSASGAYFDFAAPKTVTASGSSSYAGGLVGVNNGSAVSIYSGISDGAGGYTYSTEVYSSADIVTATEAAGGIFGYYLATADVTFNDVFGANGCKVNAKNAGGFVGVFDGDDYNITFAGADSNSHISVDSVVTAGNTVECFGGLIGKYRTNDLANVLDIEHVDVTFSKDGDVFRSDGSAFGGLVGFVDGSDANYSAAYVKIDDVVVTANSGHGTATYFGGMVGKTGNLGSLIDVGSVSLVTVGNYNGGGIVGYLDRGVLRLSGTTDLALASGHPIITNVGSTNHGQIVGRRGGSLVYALGTGSDSGATYASGWNLIRYTDNQYLDDIGTWGEVVRLNSSSGGVSSNIEDASTGVLSYDSSAHTVTVISPVKAMSSQRDVVRTALNMQLNGGNNVGALCFEDTTNKSSVLLAASDLTISGEISLSGTGITSFTRDDGANNTFTGTLSGATGSTTDKIILATGESYGTNTSGKSGTGEIFAHQYNGLFAKIGGGTISGLTIGGTINCSSNVTTVYIGGATADITAGFTATDVIFDETINYKTIAGTSHYVGGIAGLIADTNGTGKTVSISDSTVSPVINAGGALVDTDKIAGAIANVESTYKFNIGFYDSTLSYKIDGTSAASTSADLHMAGLISDIIFKGAGSSDDTRKVILSGNTFTGCEVKNNANDKSGGMLGYAWMNTDTELTNNTFSS